eukprot:SAG31_NODE_2348_length_5895_cov_69.747930_4_plen_151_part_00
MEKVIFNAITQHGGAQKSFVSDDANDTSSVDPLARVLAVTSKDCRVALRRCWDLAERQCITMGQLMKVLDALPPASRQAFHCGTLRNACVARRSPIEATDFLTLATEPYCEVSQPAFRTALETQPQQYQVSKIDGRPSCAVAARSMPRSH